MEVKLRSMRAGCQPVGADVSRDTGDSWFCGVEKTAEQIQRLLHGGTAAARVRRQSDAQRQTGSPTEGGHPLSLLQPGSVSLSLSSTTYWQSLTRSAGKQTVHSPSPQDPKYRVWFRSKKQQLGSSNNWHKWSVPMRDQTVYTNNSEQPPIFLWYFRIKGDPLLSVPCSSLITWFLTMRSKDSSTYFAIGRHLELWNSLGAMLLPLLQD